MSSEKAGDSAIAAKEYQEFLAAWRGADPELTQLTHAQAYLAEHPVAAGNPNRSRTERNAGYGLRASNR